MNILISLLLFIAPIAFAQDNDADSAKNIPCLGAMEILTAVPNGILAQPEFKDKIGLLNKGIISTHFNLEVFRCLVNKIDDNPVIYKMEVIHSVIDEMHMATPFAVQKFYILYSEDTTTTLPNVIGVFDVSEIEIVK